MKLPFRMNVASIVLVFVCVISKLKCEVFTAMSDVEKLLNTEKLLVESLESYIRMEEERIAKLKKLNEIYGKMYHEAQNDTETFLSNPVNAFLLVKHLTSNWNMVKKLMVNSESQEAMSYLFSEAGLFPSHEDLLGAADSLIRLQKFYLLDTPSLASGHIKGLIKSQELSASDCFELGKHAYHRMLSNFSLMWMQEALDRLDYEEIYEIKRTDILEYMAYSAYEVGNFSFGMSLAQEIKDLDPNYYTRINENLRYFQAKVTEMESQGESSQYSNTGRQFDIDGKLFSEKEVMKAYETLCREDSVQIRELQNKLYCYYETKNDNYFLLGPVKVEVLSSDPQIVLFHDVMTENEINEIKTIAIPTLERAVVQDPYTGEIQVTTDRISKSTTFEDHQHEIIARISRRIQYVSGLSIGTAEPIDIINYGIGGHYEPHFDFALSGEKLQTFHNVGNRIATWIFYMSDVAAGGSTVFPIIGVKVKPVKGSAGFWYNLKENGEDDKRMFHAACPVLSGSKWVGNKWLHEYGNEFRRPCNLNPKK